jgi:hypothetical protein
MQDKEAAKLFRDTLASNRAQMVEKARVIIHRALTTELNGSPVENVMYDLFQQDEFSNIYAGLIDIEQHEVFMAGAYNDLENKDIEQTEYDIFIEAAVAIENDAHEVAKRLRNIKRHGL